MDRIAICLNDRGYVDLARGRAYRVIGDPKAAKFGQIRIVDGSGKDYLYSKADFHVSRLPRDAAEYLLKMPKSKPHPGGMS